MSTGVRAGIAVGGICAPVLILVCVIVGCYVCRNDPNFRCCPPPGMPNSTQISNSLAAGGAHVEVEYIHTFIAESSLGGG